LCKFWLKQICFSDRPIDTFLQEAWNAWKTRCNKTAVIALLRSVLRGGYEPLMPYIELAVNAVEEFFESLTDVGCPRKIRQTPNFTRHWTTQK